MPLQVNIKRRAPRFKGDEPSFHAVVSGPRETFKPDLCRMLELHGLAPFKDEEGFSIWSAMPSSGPPPYYLAHLLRHKHGVRIARDCVEDVQLPVGQRPRGNASSGELSHALSNAAFRNHPAGRQRLAVRASSKDFVANCNDDDALRTAFLEAAGWIPLGNVPKRLADRLGTRPYRTRDPIVAANLEPFMPDAVRGRLAEMLNATKQHIAASRARESNSFVPTPEGLDLFPFQKNGVGMAIASPGGAIIADDMGLGKTLQGIGVINASPGARNILVVCQASMRIKWGQEIEKWRTDPNLDVGLAEGSNFPETAVVVINYDILARHEERLRSRQWDIVICDEAHNLKNPEARRTRALMGDILDETGGNPLPLSKHGRLLHLTGTPRPNRPEELWPLLSSTRPDIWGRGPEAYRVFRNRYAPPILVKTTSRSPFGPGNEVIVPMNGKPVRETELQLRLRGSGSFVRRLKRDMGDQLPDKFRSRIDIPVRLSAEEKASLRKAEFDLERLLGRTGRVEVRKGGAQKAGAVIDKLPTMNPDRPDFTEMSRVRLNLGRLKAPHCARFILDEIEEENDLDPCERTKTVMFAHHKDVVAALHGEAERRMPGACLVYDGTIAARRRQEIVDRFQEDDDVRAMIITLSGATGITLTKAARMRVVEPDWSPSNMVQVEDRIWRIGQERNVEIGYMSVAGTLDARIGAALVSKMESDERTLNRVAFLHDKAPDPLHPSPSP
ncbi:MAG: DEAD/DEAH box helicase [Boseongicola sp. SB0677_bin_26]|nr:DEAD/DEAH box helicase [Boseongicola sp. SB0665_bin_10]MYG25055.1 DEAD/DEAH box helicase [Boseongicola sp. SB0677_bin_26]